MKLILYISLLLSFSGARAQYLVSSNTSIESCNDVEGCLTVKGSSYLYYDVTKNEFFLKVDFDNFRKGLDTVDNWLTSQKDTSLYYRMIFPKENFPVLASEERRTYKLNGRIFFNNSWKEQTIELTLFPSQNSLTNNNSDNSTYSIENYKVNFSLPFVPSDYKDYKELYYYSQNLSINVTLGRINLLKPGMETLLSEVYYLPYH